eukprot:2870184-Alexandrium_andersonii.AAC.1
MGVARRWNLSVGHGVMQGRMLVDAGFVLLCSMLVVLLCLCWAAYVIICACEAVHRFGSHKEEANEAATSRVAGQAA